MERNAGNIAFHNMPAIEAMLSRMGRTGATARQVTGMSATGSNRDPAGTGTLEGPPAPGGAPAGAAAPGGLEGPPMPASMASMGGGTGLLPNNPAGPGGTGPGSVTGPGGQGTGTFNAEGRDAFGNDGTTLLEPYAQEQGWSTRDGNRAMFGDEFQKADAAWELFSSGATANDVAQKEAFTRQYLAQATSPGGSYYTEDQVRNAILNGPPDSTFNMTMQGLDPSQQVQYTNNTYFNALAGTVPGPMLQARHAQMQQWGNEYIAWTHTRNAGGGPGMSYTEWLVATGKM